MASGSRDPEVCPVLRDQRDPSVPLATKVLAVFRDRWDFREEPALLVRATCYALP